MSLTPIFGGIVVNIKDLGKKRIPRIISFFLTLFCMLFLNYQFNHYQKYKGEVQRRLYENFEAFGRSIEGLNDNISRILVMKDYNSEREFMDVNVLNSFNSSSFIAQDLSKSSNVILYDRIYSRANGVISRILSDGMISEDEEKYLNTLYDYNNELIKEYKNIIGDLYDPRQFKKLMKLMNNMTEVYNDFIQVAFDLANTEKYGFIKDYRGYFKDGDLESAKKYCEEVLSKLTPNKSLGMDTVFGENPDTYIFTTGNLNSDNLMKDEVEYDAIFNRKTKEVSISATGYMIKNTGLTEKDLDDRAKNIFSQFKSNLSLFDRKVIFDDKGKLDQITYSYIEKNNDVYDEMKKIEFTIQRQGIINNFKIVYPSDKQIALPPVSQKEILAKVDKKGEIAEVLLIRNVEGKMEYEAHIKYNGTLYAAVFDGENGDLKYFGRSLRNYNGI